MKEAGVKAFTLDELPEMENTLMQFTVDFAGVDMIKAFLETEGFSLLYFSFADDGHELGRSMRRCRRRR